ncbi:glycosyltransferase family 2 protein [Taklimakanibacter lacteus]|uniref:glycosyltransferase family 2 protein n=1 Tax=Taklimakanibacter lacteus TaxID=2268456 RepID=UPI0013C4599D
MSAAIAIVMPVYNREASVDGAIRSVLAQSFGDFEFLIVDDGSTDRTEAVIAEFADKRIRYLRQPKNQGGNAARNRGVREAGSPIVCFIDSDDQFLPHKLDFVVDYFGRNPDVDVLIDSFELVYPPEKNKAKVLRRNPVLQSSADVERAIFSRTIFKATPAVSARRSALIAAGLFDETLKRRQDMDMVLRLARTARCATTDQVLWVKHWSPESISAKQHTFMDAMLEMCRRHPDYLVRPEYRIGLARDLARHFVRLFAKGQFTTAVRDGRRFIGLHGGLAFMKLVMLGTGEMLRRAMK